MHTTIRSVSIAVWALASMTLTCLPAHADVKGANVKHVECWKDGKVQITFDQVGNSTHWAEHNQNGTVDKGWTAGQRDEWSVYLSKSGVELQLDLHAKKCAWNAGGNVTHYNVKNAR